MLFTIYWDVIKTKQRNLWAFQKWINSMRQKQKKLILLFKANGRMGVGLRETVKVLECSNSWYGVELIRVKHLTLKNGAVYWYYKKMKTEVMDLGEKPKVTKTLWGADRNDRNWVFTECLHRDESSAQSKLQQMTWDQRRTSWQQDGQGNGIFPPDNDVRRKGNARKSHW